MLAVIILGCTAAIGAVAQQQRVIYLEGDPQLRRGASSVMLNFGEELRGGDSIRTGRADLVELQQGSGNTITIHPDTTFSVNEISVDGETERQLTASRGSASFRFTQPGGARRVGTATTTAGIRGTEFTMFAAADGAAFYVVESGLVEVESQGTRVEVAANQAVEVAPNQPPGEVVSWIGRTLDFSDWNGERLDAFLEDPQGTLQGLTEQLFRFARRMEATEIEYRSSRAQLDAARAYMRELQQQGSDEFEDYRDTIVPPYVRTTSNLFLNTRYFALSALSLRRHVVGSLYVQAKARVLLEPDSRWAEYMEDHSYFVQQFETRIVPLLEDDDI